MLARAILQQRKPEDQAAGPENQQEDERQRPEIAEKILALPRRLDEGGNPAPRPPGITVKPDRNTKLPSHAAWQDDRFKRVQQDGEDYDDASDCGEDMHSKSKVKWRKW